MKDPRSLLAQRLATAAILTAFLAGEARAASPGGPPDPLDEVREKIARLVEEKKAPSLSIAVVKNGEIVWEEAFGLADLEKRTRATPDTLYAIALAWPENGEMIVRSLAQPAGKLRQVSLLGHRGELAWSQTADGLAVKLPAQKPCDHAFVLKIAGDDLRPVKPDTAKK